jgi:membrane fusion protein, multidrug efflux system
LTPVEPEHSRGRGPLLLFEHARTDDPKPAPSVRPVPERREPRRPRRHWRRWPALLLPLFLVAGGIGWALLPPAVAVVEPRRGPAVQAVYATGTVEPSLMVPIAARSAARLIELAVDEGAEVAEGQLLGRLEDADLRRAIEVAEAEERYAKAQLDRLAQLVARQVATRASYDRAQADWEKAVAARERAVAEAGFLNLLAPADGTIIRRDGEIGQLIGANETVMWLAARGPLRISTAVDEEDIARVREGQRVLIRADAFPGEIFDGEVQAITPKGDPVARTYRVRVLLPPDTKLMIGMTAETNIVLRQEDDALLVPASAVQDDTVWLVADGRLVPREVTLGAKGATEVEILSGIAEGDRIVAAPVAGMRAGQAVRQAAAASRQ